LGTAFPETDVDKADLETVIGDLMSGQYSDPVRVVAFNTAEHWAEDASEDVAREVMRRFIVDTGICRPSLVLNVYRHCGSPKRCPYPRPKPPIGGVKPTFPGFTLAVVSLARSRPFSHITKPNLRR
jgi:hypothetical protein